MIKLIVANLGLYNAGKHWSASIELPKKEDELKDVLNAISKNGQNDMIILDYEMSEELKGLKIDEYQNIEELNDVLKRLQIQVEERGEQIVNLFKAVFDYDGDLTRTIKGIEEYKYLSFEGVTDEESFGEAIVESGQLGEIPQIIKQYLDYEQIANDWTCNGWIIYPQYEIAIYTL